MTDTVHATTGLAEAATAFEGLLSDDLLVGDTENPGNTQAEVSEQPKPKVKAQAETEEEGDEGTEAPHETTDEDSDGEGADEGSEEGEGEQEATAEEEEAEEGSPVVPKTATVKIDGKDVEVPFEEVIKGYQRHADYSRKTQALADDRRAFDEVRSTFDQTEKVAVQQERGQYATLLKALHQRLDELSPQEPNWQELFARDKEQYLIERDNWRMISEQRAATAAELERVDGSNRAQSQKAFSEHLNAERGKLLEKMPTWQDEKVRAADLAALRAYAKTSLGFTDQEIAQAADHRTLIALHKAMKYDQMQAKVKTIVPNGKNKSKTLKPGSGAQQQTAPSKALTSAKNRLAQSGSINDAAAIFSGMDL